MSSIKLISSTGPSRVEATLIDWSVETTLSRTATSSAGVALPLAIDTETNTR